MKRRSFLLGGLSAGAACSRGPRLNVYNWSDYISTDVVRGFEREFALQVHYGTYESNQEMLAQVMSGNSGWDVVFPSEDFIGPMRELGLLAELDHGRLPNLKNLAPEFQRPPWDPDLRWSVPYMHGCTGILYQSNLPHPPLAWADLWQESLRGRVTMLDDPPEVFAAALKKLGYSLNSADPQQLRQARDQAVAQKILLRGYLNAEARDQAIAGDLLAAQAWAVTAAQAIAAAPGKFSFSFPREGFPRFADNVAILRESGRQERAHQWIDYLLRPQSAAAIVISTQTATANGEATRLLPPGVRQNPVLYPSQEILERGEWFQAPTAASQRLRDRLWSEIKSS